MSPTSPPLSDDEHRRGQLLLRTLPLALLPVIIAIATGLFIRFAYIGAPADLDQVINHDGPRLLTVLLVGFIFAIALLVLARLGQPTLSAIAFISVWTLAITIAGMDASVKTVWPALLILPICAASLLFDGMASATVALLATMLVAVFATLEVYGIRIPLVRYPLPHDVFSPMLAASVWIGAFWTVVALTGMLAGNLKRALSQSRSHASELRDLSAELERRVAEQTAELARRAERAEALYDVSRALTGVLDQRAVLALIAEQAARLLRFDSALVLLHTPGRDGFDLVGTYQPPPAVEQLLADTTPELLALASQPGPQVVSLHDQANQRYAALCLPLLYNAELIGVLLLIDGASGAGRDLEDLALAEGLSDQATLAIANARLVAQLQTAATLEERTRLAREIHDTLAQGLAGIVVQLNAARESLDAAPREVVGHLELARRMARESLAEARRSVWNLRAPALERAELADALRSLSSHRLTPGLTINFALHGTSRPLTPTIESALLRVCQEALANVAKHANASQVKVEFSYHPDSVELSIRDNGVGFAPETVLAPALGNGPTSGFGLLGMRERLAQLGGQLEVIVERGTLVRAIVPLESERLP